jgi:TM2 domain-containing membrane protein YozV
VGPDYYSVLGVPVRATADQIERAYKLLVRMSHPDVFPNDRHAQSWANERMKLINEAYTTLRDATRRAGYDRIHMQQDATSSTASGATTDHRVRCPACRAKGTMACVVCDGSGSQDCPGCYGAQVVTCPVCSGAGSLSQSAYEQLIEELVQAEARSEKTDQQYGSQRSSGRAGRDPFWEVGYWDLPQPNREPLLTSLRLAAALSLFIPGAGQLYNREPQKALTYLGIAFMLFVGVSLLKGLGLLLLLAFWIYNVYDAHSAAGKR